MTGKIVPWNEAIKPQPEPTKAFLNECRALLQGEGKATYHTEGLLARLGPYFFGAYGDGARAREETMAFVRKYFDAIRSGALDREPIAPYLSLDAMVGTIIPMLESRWLKEPDIFAAELEMIIERNPRYDVDSRVARFKGMDLSKPGVYELYPGLSIDTREVRLPAHDPK